MSAISSQYQVREFLLRTVLPVIYRLGVTSGGPCMFGTVTALSRYFWRPSHSHWLHVTRSPACARRSLLATSVVPRVLQRPVVLHLLPRVPEHGSLRLWDTWFFDDSPSESEPIFLSTSSTNLLTLIWSAAYDCAGCHQCNVLHACLSSDLAVKIASRGPLRKGVCV